MLYLHGWTSPSYVYHIRAAPNFIDVNAMLRQYSPHPEQSELAALGGIRWGQEVVGEFVRNPDYNHALYGNFPISDPQPQLAGFPYYHEAWHFEPWVAHATCELKSTCSSNKSEQQFGADWFWKSYHTVIARAMVVLD
ncbi:enterotoxin A family protein [Bartonella sp. WD12.1]|uniref:enterotoxin A family protein n=1 Tax=Bartonella sp. WD12.1 TaxID=1933903 RepID=UPI0009CB0A97|nr:enterotoxin A family protein [Bartonella sp. WD12.1]OPB30017.1 Heat-labile enterotoxin alpha chain [Bartonella sp. WD12.1]